MPASTQSPFPLPLPATSPLARVGREARKWWRMLGLYFQDALAYRATALIWILTDTVPLLIQPLLWLSAFHGRAQIGSFAPAQIVAYYVVLAGVTNLVQCHAHWEIAGDIKEGRFSAYLIRPFSYATMSYLAFISWRLLRTLLFAPIFVGVILLFGYTLHGVDCHPNGAFFLSLFLAHLVSFAITFPFGLLALYFVETRSLFNFWYLPLTIFSGEIAPLSLFPPVWRTVADVLPFRYTVSFPTEIFLGQLSPAQIERGLLLQIVWIVAGWGLGTLLWRRGIRRFVGVGQ